MKYIQALLLICFLNCTYAQVEDSYTQIGDRQMLSSKYLDEDRFFQIYLPPSYHAHPNAKFPVLYLIDGDYNFHYDSGLIEFLSRTAYKIPEMIVIGISDKGSTKYRTNCSPNTENGAGNADNYMQFIQYELKPHIKTNYRAAELDIIVGHSMGGLFTTNYWLERPDDFDIYLAIDPSLWWNDYAMPTKAENRLKSFDKQGSQFFISLANTKGMGVQQLVGVLDKYFPDEVRWNYKHYTDENHGSLHMMAISDALTSTFKDWDISRATFYGFEGPDDIIAHYNSFKMKFDMEFLLPAYTLGNMIYFYFRQNKTEDLQLLETGIKTHFPNSLETFYTQLAQHHLNAKNIAQAETLYEQCLAIAPQNVNALDGLSKIRMKQEQLKDALSFSEKAIISAKQQHFRQYLLNELQSQYLKIKAALKP